MNETYIRDELFKHFNTLNEFSQINFLTGENVYLPNIEFKPPIGERWFELSFLSTEPSPVSIGKGSQNRFNGFLQIDICTPLNTGTDETDDIYSFVSGLFSRGTVISNCIEINKVYIAQTGEEKLCYRTVVRVEWTADIDN